MLFLDASKTFLQNLGEQAETVSDYGSSPTGYVRESGISMPYLIALKNVLKQAVPNVRSWRLNQALRLPAGTCESSAVAGGAPAILVQLLPLKVLLMGPQDPDMK